jgi:sulfide dehydrogenase cytochrome subunit
MKHFLAQLPLRLYMKIDLALISLFSLVAMPGTVLALDSPEATNSPPEICADCHGEDGASTEPDVPVIGGLSAFAIEENLFAFRDHGRPCRTTFYRTGVPGRPTTDMCQIAADLSDDDVFEIAVFFSSKPFVPAAQQTDPEKAAMGAEVHRSGCHLCHGKGGGDPADHASILAGQSMRYLTMSFINFRAERRWMPRAMEARLQELTDQEVEALVHFYGAGGNEP